MCRVLGLSRHFILLSKTMHTVNKINFRLLLNFSSDWGIKSLKTVFDYISEHTEVHQKYSPARHIFNSFFGVWKCGQTRSYVFDVLLILRTRFSETWLQVWITLTTVPIWKWRFIHLGGYNCALCHMRLINRTIVTSQMNYHMTWIGWQQESKHVPTWPPRKILCSWQGGGGKWARLHVVG